jgi:hypothetical protein
VGRVWCNSHVRFLDRSYTKNIINFLVYCNGMIYFLRTANATKKCQDHKFIIHVCFGCTDLNEVTTNLPFMYRSIIIQVATTQSA